MMELNISQNRIRYGFWGKFGCSSGIIALIENLSLLSVIPNICDIYTRHSLNQSPNGRREF